jgi:hypothetical protein
MTTQPEQVLENNLVTQLIGLGHPSVTIKRGKLITLLENTQTFKKGLLQQLFV